MAKIIDDDATRATTKTKLMLGYSNDATRATTKTKRMLGQYDVAMVTMTKIKIEAIDQMGQDLQGGRNVTVGTDLIWESFGVQARETQSGIGIDAEIAPIPVEIETEIVAGMIRRETAIGIVIARKKVSVSAPRILVDIMRQAKNITRLLSRLWRV